MISKILLISGLSILYIVSVIAIHFGDRPTYRAGRQTPAQIKNKTEEAAQLSRNESANQPVQPSVEKAS